MKKIITLLMSIVFVNLITLNIARAANDPQNFLQSIANQMISQLKSHKASLKTNPSLVYSLAYKIVVPRADLDEMSKRVLPPQTWSSASAQQRQEFKREFTNTLVRTYSSALAEYNDQTIKFFPVRGGYAGKRDVQVNSEIMRTDGPSIAVNYHVLQKGSGWKLYDMTVEGVSMLESFRSQFADQLSKGNMSELLRVLKSHNSNS